MLLLLVMTVLLLRRIVVTGDHTGTVLVALGRALR